jgi:hypothetical protein
MSRWPPTEADIDTVQLTSFESDNNDYKLRWITRKVNGRFYYRDTLHSVSVSYSSMIRKETKYYEEKEKLFPSSGRIIKYKEPGEEHHLQFWRENKHLALMAAALSEKNYKSFVHIGILREGELETTYDPDLERSRSLIRKSSVQSLYKTNPSLNRHSSLPPTLRATNSKSSN